MPALYLALLLTLAAAAADWPVYGGDPGGSKHSALKQIDRSNVARLQVAWTFSTGESLEPLRKGGRGPAFEATPIVVDGIMYFGTPYGKVFALDAATGKLRWSYDTNIDRKGNYGDFANRGVSTWLDPLRKTGDSCRRIIYMASIDARLTALDAGGGKLCGAFGKNGEIDLTRNLRNEAEYKGEYEETSPPAVIGDMVVVGSAIADNHRAKAPSGEVRGFDARTGALKWTWHPMPGETSGAANAWSIISVDAQRNLVFVPTGSPSPDYWGGLRPGDNKYANSVVALNASTGAVVWGVQTVHHDLWDYDVASQPMLFTMKRGGVDVPAVAIGSKTGHLFLVTRDKGQPIFGIEERKAPASDIDGEQASPTQPVPVLPKPWLPQSLRPEDAWGATEADRKACREEIATLRNEGIFTPPSLRGSLVVPGNVGGMHWGGMAWDPANGLILVPANNLPAVVKLIPRDSKDRPAGTGWEFAGQRGAPYAMVRRLLRAPSGLPCSAPPWGTLAAIEAATGKLAWQVPLGDLPGAPPDLGSINLGGPITTGGGLVLIGASLDPYLKAFDVTSGKVLWKGQLPASARSVPMTYAVDGRQYIAIAAGGHESSVGKLANTVVVFALP